MGTSSQRKTINQIAKELGYTNGTPLHKYFKKFDIEVIRFDTLLHLLYKGDLEEAKNTPAILYYLRFYDNETEFWKIGITSTTIKQRFYGCKLNYEVLSEEKLNYYDAYLREQEILKENKNYRISINTNDFKTTEAFSENIL